MRTGRGSCREKLTFDRFLTMKTGRVRAGVFGGRDSDLGSARFCPSQIVAVTLACALCPAKSLLIPVIL